MTLRNLQFVVAAVCLVSLPGMILSAIFSHLGAVIGFGIASSISMLTMIVATSAVEASGRERISTTHRSGENLPSTATTTSQEETEALGRALEEQIEHLVSLGASEEEVRLSVAMATRLGRILHFQ